MNRFDRRALNTKKRSIMSINGYIKSSSKQKINSCSLVNSQQKNFRKVTAKKEKKEFNFELFEAKLKSIEEKYGERIMNLEQKVLEQQDQLDKIQKKDVMKQQMINSLKELNEKKVKENEAQVKEEVIEKDVATEDVATEDVATEEVKELVSQEIEEKKKEQNVHLTIEE